MRDVLICNSAIEVLALQAQQAQEEIVALRLANERRFGTPIGACPWGCDGSGWNELADYLEPDGLDIFWRGGWWTPCECNVASTHWEGDLCKWARRYPDDYDGPRTSPPEHLRRN